MNAPALISRNALEASPQLDLVTALRRVEAAKRDCDLADVFCTSDDYERVHHDLMSELIALYHAGDALGINMRAVFEAGR